MNTSEMKLKSMPVNRIPLGGIALVVAGLTILAAAILSINATSNPIQSR